ncbi:acyl carrier protein [Streptomyces sp. NPDC058657]|uniref:acyl carrier protein n=1 Tax=unclassified Streptomyces TaxID=2593676 RepID=UPI0036630EAA
MQTTVSRESHSTDHARRTTHAAEARRNRITEIVCDRLELEPEDLGEGDLFVEEHGADSLALIGVLAALEKEFRVTIDQNEMPRMTCLRGVRQVLAETAGW